MRTVIVAFAIGATVIAWRSLRGKVKLAFTFALFFVLAFGASSFGKLVIEMLCCSAIRVRHCACKSLERTSRIPIHPIFGHGMDAMKLHWTEWGFPGKDMLHLHSTPLQLAFDRGLAGAGAVVMADDFVLDKNCSC